MPAKTVAEHYGMDGERLERQYKEHLSGYREWDQLGHAEEWLLFPGNMGRMLSIDETAPSQGELYTIVSNKESHNGKGTIVAIVRGTKIGGCQNRHSAKTQCAEKPVQPIRQI